MSRDTQFAGFAKLLFDKLYDQFNALRYLEYDMAGLGRDKEVEQAKQGILDTIAEAGYSLARHAAFHIDEQACDVLGFEGAMHRIPDMTEWHRED